MFTTQPGSSATVCTYWRGVLLHSLPVSPHRPEDQWTDLSCPVGDGAPLRAAIVPAVGPPALYTVQQGSLTLEASVLTFPV